MDSQAPLMVASPNMEAKSRLFEPRVTLRIWLIIIKVGSWTCYEQYAWDSCWELSVVFCLTRLWTQAPNLTPQKVLPSRHPCHVGDLRLGTSCVVVSPNFRALNGWDCTDWLGVPWDLGCMWSGPKFKQGGWVWVDHTPRNNFVGTWK